MQYAFQRMPQTDRELYHWIRAVWGWTIPWTPVCPQHTTPFQAFADAFFCRSPIVIWKASRGFGGKTNTLGLLGQTEAASLNAQVSILGGSGAQSTRVYEAGQEAWASPNAPKQILEASNRYITRFTTKAWIETLMASQRSVRGTHPQRLRMDEIDEMDLEILEASLGTVMEGRRGLQKGIQPHIVMSSTHQYPDKTMTEMLKRAAEGNWPVFEWCYKECMNPVDGWLSQKEVDTKRLVVPKAMWEAEYDLQEPSFEGRAIDTEAVEYAFSPDIGETDDTHWKERSTSSHLMHVTGVDWAKQRDLTVAATFDAVDDVWRCVEWQCFNRLPWPAQVAKVERQYETYGGFFAHDATGIGNVLADYLSPDMRRRNKDRIHDEVLTSSVRAALFTDYISAIEDGKIVYPRIKQAYDEHRYATMEDLFGKGHPPDSIVAGAVAWGRRHQLRKGRISAPVGITRAVNPVDLTKVTT